MKTDVKFNSKYKPFFHMVHKKRAIREPMQGVRYVVLIGGRGSGKSFALAKWVNSATFCKYNVLFTRFTLTSAETSVIPEFRNMCETIGNDSDFSFKRNQVINRHTGAVIDYKGLKPTSNHSTGALKSIANKNVFIVEEAEDCQNFELFDKVDNSIRMKGKHNIIVLCLNQGHVSHWIFKEFIEPYNKGLRDDTIVIESTYLDNLKHLDESFINKANRLKETNISRYNHVFLNKWKDDVDGALWRQNNIDDNRILAQADRYKRIVISIDPAVTSNENSDEHGLVVVGMVSKDEFHVLEDQTCQATPDQICQMAVALYNKYSADRIIGEVNNGGEWIEQLLRTVDRNISYKAIRASRGKITRAEPIASLYDQNKVKHVGFYATLEYEMTTYTGDPREKSPNAMDALVWGLTELSVNNRTVTSREV